MDYLKSAVGNECQIYFADVKNSVCTCRLSVERYVVVFKWRLKIIEVLSPIGSDWPLDMSHTSTSNSSWAKKLQIPKVDFSGLDRLKLEISEIWWASTSNVAAGGALSQF